MMMIPRKNSFDLFDEMFDDPFMERGFFKKENSIMKTDIKEKDGNYVLEIDMPGYDKEDIKIELEKGYITVTANKESNKEEEDKKSHYIHKERFYGSCSRSYYVGDKLTEDQIKASFKNGMLTLTFPKNSEEKIEEKKYIQIGE